MSLLAARETQLKTCDRVLGASASLLRAIDRAAGSWQMADGSCASPRGLVLVSGGRRVLMSDTKAERHFSSKWPSSYL